MHVCGAGDLEAFGEFEHGEFRADFFVIAQKRHKNSGGAFDHRPTFDNLVYRRFIEGSSQEIRRGGELAPFLAKQATLFPPFVTGMIQIGEATGNLDENLIYVSEYYEEEMAYKLDALTSIIEPVMLLFMGLLVGFVAISIITPIYSISANISNDLKCRHGKIWSARGSTLIDIVISIGIIIVLFGGIYLVYFSLYGAIANIEARASATAVLNQEARNDAQPAVRERGRRGRHPCGHYSGPAIREL